MTMRSARRRLAMSLRAPLLMGCAVLLSACGPEGAGTVDMSKARQARAAPAPEPTVAKAKSPAAKVPAKAPANPSERLSPPGQRSGRPTG
jgi:hypothetical protein